MQKTYDTIVNIRQLHIRVLADRGRCVVTFGANAYARRLMSWIRWHFREDRGLLD
jgi:hypothetical protein